jgi:hypothetical protein
VRYKAIVATDASERERPAGPLSASDAQVLGGLAEAPPLAVLAAVLAVVDLALNRIAPLVVNMLSEDRNVAVHLLAYGALPRNVAAIAGIVALAAALWSALRMAGWAGLWRRLQVAGLSGLLFPALLLGLLLPKERMPSPVVLVAVGVGHALVALFGMVVLPYRSASARRASLGASLTSGLVLTLLVASSLETIQRFLETPESLLAKVTWSVMAGSRLLGECVWCVVPWLALGPSLRSLVVERRVRRALLPALAAALALAAAAQAWLHPHYTIVAYSAFRLTFLPEAWAGLHGLLSLVALAVAGATLLSERAEHRQHAAAVLLWIACGFSPRSLVQVLYFVLAAALLARVAQVSDPEGRRRALLPWGALRGAAAVPEDLR